MNQSFWRTIVNASSGLILLAAAVQIVFFQSQYYIIADNAIMLEFARRFSEGGKVVLNYADVNLPHSVLLYIPAVWLGKITGLPLYYAFIVYVYSAATLSTLLIWRILLRLPFLDKIIAAGGATVFWLAFLYISGIHIGQRDPLIFLGLMPLVLAQFCLNANIALPRRLLFPALAVGALLIMIKPHYGLMPALMLAWPLLRGQTIKSLLYRTDALILAITTVLTILISVSVFYAYYDVLLGDILALYAGRTGQITTIKFALTFSYFIFSVPAAMILLQDAAARRFCFFLSIIGMSLLVSYYAQYKGLYYHLIPALILVFTHLYFLAALRLKERGMRADSLTVAGTALLLLLFFSPAHHYPTHSDAKTMPVAALLKECDPPCRFFMTNEHSFMYYETSLYADAFFASRFSSLWFTPGLYCRLKSKPEDKNAQEIWDKYAHMVIEDLEHYKPSMLILYTEPEQCPNGMVVPQVFPDLFLEIPAFAKLWETYHFEKNTTLNRRDYYRDTDGDYDHMISFDVYRRKTP